MGEEIDKVGFSDEDFRAFEQRLREETDLLEVWFKNNRFASTQPMGGFELEAWLVDKDCQPVPRNLEFLEHLNSPLVVPELSKFNIEFNTEPQYMNGRALGRMEEGLQETWIKANKAAEDLNLNIIMIGILPTIKNHHLTIENMSSTGRFKAINEQIFRMRDGKPIQLAAKLNDGIDTTHEDVMLEAGATSFQIHLKVSPHEGAAYYNASKVASAPTVAVSANSPFLFGRNLWAETRIKLFEKAVSVGDWDYAERVTFGVRYLDDSLLEVFVANRQRYPALLPQIFDESPQNMRHVRLHNGTIWRWNRPIIGFDYDGTPHLRIEHRPIAAGPTVVDEVANAAFYYGLVRALAPDMKQLQWDLPFHRARDNFYACARHGLAAECRWTDGQPKAIRETIVETLIPMAEKGLKDFGLDETDIKTYLTIIDERTRSGQNGAEWQRAWVNKHGNDMVGLCRAYRDRMMEGAPVHQWNI